MKLRNKKTGEMGIINYFDNQSIVIYPIDENWDAKGDKKYVYHSLADLNEEWEDYEENEYYYAITSIKTDGGITKMKNKHNDMTAFDKQIGNCFTTKEEAEEAVEKLKAWKRLKDKGFKFDGYDVAHNSNGDLCGQLFYNAGDYCIEDVEKDLDLLFCPEENI